MSKRYQQNHGLFTVFFRSCIFVFLIFFMNTYSLNQIKAISIQPVIGEEGGSYKGDGTKETPKRYLIGDDSKVTWKHLNELKEKKIWEVYEKREGDEEEGKLEYQYTINPTELLAPEGPYFLGIRSYDNNAAKELFSIEDAVYLSFATKRDFPETLEITYYVGEQWKDGESISIYYYGGYDSTVVHSEAPIVEEDEISQFEEVKLVNENLIVKNGYITMKIDYGGNYILTKEPITTLQKGQENTANETKTTYAPEQVLGTIEAVFSEEKLKNAIASSLEKTITDTITQKELNRIKKLYVNGSDIKTTELLEPFSFERIEQISLLNGKLATLEKLEMPRLTYLDVSNNHLKSLKNISAFPKLENIKATGNEIQELPDFSNFSNIKTLDLSDNQLENIPPISSDSMLYLDISKNHIYKEIDLTNLPHLKKVDVSNQSYETTILMQDSSSYILDPIPALISQYGSFGTMVIKNEDGTVLKEESFRQLEKENFQIDFKNIPSASSYDVIISGYLEEEKENLLGNYTYHFQKENTKNPSIVIVLEILTGSVLLVIGGIFFYRKKGKGEKKNETRSGAFMSTSSGNSF